MANKNWNDKLRERMSEFEQTPPEGLWEAIETAGAGKAGAAAGAGLLSRLFGGRAPLWWSLAGVAAAAAVALLVIRPSSSPVSTQDPAALVAETKTETEELPSGSEAQQALEAEASPVAEITQAEPSQASEPAPVSKPSVRQSRPTKTLVEEQQVEDQPLQEEVQPEQVAVKPEQTEAQAEPQQPAQQSVEASDEQESQAPAIGPGTPTTPAPRYNTVPLTRKVKKDRPLVAVNLVGGGMPGHSSITNITSYGIRSFTGPMARTISAISRNRVTETEILRKMDLQTAIMVSLDLTKHIGIETGLQYTRLSSSTVSITGSVSSTTDDVLSYIGLPVHLIYTPLQGRFLSAYLSAGPELEYGLTRNWTVSEVINASRSFIDNGVEGLGDFVISASVNAGLQVHPFRTGAFFVQPGVVFRHVDENAFESYYTDHPVSFRLAAGYRITF